MTERLRGAGMTLSMQASPDLRELKDEELLRELAQQDDRLEMEDPAVPGLAANAVKQASAVAAIIPVARMTERADGSWVLAAPTMGDFFNVDPAERFREQPIAAVGAATLITKTHVVTAAHVTPNAQILRRVKLVFGYRVVNGSAPSVFSANHVYTATLFWIDRRFDLAILELDRPVPDHHAPIATHGTVVADEALYVIGYPIGLPAKFAGNGHVMNNQGRRFFTADLDVMDASSGSPVFRASNGDLVGVVSTAPVGFTTIGGKLVTDFSHDPNDVPVGISRITNLPH